MEKLTQKQIGSRSNNRTTIKEQVRIDGINKELEKLYKVDQVLANGVHVPGTYLDMGITKKDVFKKY